LTTASLDSYFHGKRNIYYSPSLTSKWVKIFFLPPILLAVRSITFRRMPSIRIRTSEFFAQDHQRTLRQVAEVLAQLARHPDEAELGVWLRQFYLEAVQHPAQLHTVYVTAQALERALRQPRPFSA
jgi:hypothetical protein